MGKDTHARAEGASVVGTGPKLTLTEIAERIDEHLRRMACDRDGFNAERFWDSIKTGRRESMGRPLYGASARRAGNRVAITYKTYQGSWKLTRDRALAYLIWLDAGNRGTHYQFEQRPSSPPLDPQSEIARLRALLKQAHDRDKWQGEFPTIAWYDEVARYFRGQVPNGTAPDPQSERRKPQASQPEPPPYTGDEPLGCCLIHGDYWTDDCIRCGA